MDQMELELDLDKRFKIMDKPGEPTERLRAAETSCFIDLCNSSCMSMQASSILCMLFILCCSLAKSILRSFTISHSCFEQSTYHKEFQFHTSISSTKGPSGLVLRFQSEDAHFAVTNYLGVILDPRWAENRALVMKVEWTEDSQHHLFDPHSGLQFAAPDLALLKQVKVVMMLHGVPSQPGPGLACPHMIVSTGPDFHGNHSEED